MFVAGVAAFSLVACSDASFDEKYPDPSKTSTVGVPQVFTGVLQAGNTWMNPVYYRYYTQSTTSGVFSGVIGNANSRGRFQGASEAYFDTRWRNFYNMATQFRLLEKNYNDLEDAQKEANKIFYLLGRSVTEAQLHEMLSLFGDVPYTQAGTLWMTGDYAAAKPSYDDDEALYKMILADLKEAGDYLSGEVSAAGIAALGRQDYTLAEGKKEIWQKYVNSLRLRIAMHLSTNGSLKGDAQAAVKEILGNPSKYPVIESNDENMGVAGDTSNDFFNYGKSIGQALAGRGESAGSQAMLDAMNVPANGTPDENTDPRLAAVYDGNPDGQYIAYDVTKTSQEISNISDAKNKEYVDRGMIAANYYCVVDSAAFAGYTTYQGNANLNGLWIGAAEVALLKAEAYALGYASGDAKAAFVNGVALSNEYFWNMKLTSSLTSKDENGVYNDSGNPTRPSFRALTVPTDADFRAYAEKIWDGSQKCIATQLWLNHCYMNELEAWNVVRRTGYPVVKFAKDTQHAAYGNPPGRLPYPSDEVNYNTENYNEARAKNYKEETGYYTTLFWAKDVYYTLVQ